MTRETPTPFPSQAPPDPTQASPVGPDFQAVADASRIESIIGALMTYGIALAVLMVIVSAAAWAVATATGNWQGVSRAKTGLAVALLSAVALGGGVAWANWLLDLGASL